MTKRLKTYIKSHFPFLVPIWRRAMDFPLSIKAPNQVFSEIFRENKWGDRDSLSGPGSNLAQTEAIRRSIPLLFQEIGCKSLLDIPCGDFFWMKLVEMDIEYTGGDIIEELIRNNQEKYGNNNRRFINLDILQSNLPKADLILCRDCLVHFSYRHIFRALKNIKNSGSTYFLTTTFVERKRNENIPTGAWRPINLQLPPFNFPTPINLIDEECPLDDYRDKHLGLWKTDDIPYY